MFVPPRHAGRRPGMPSPHPHTSTSSHTIKRTLPPLTPCACAARRKELLAYVLPPDTLAGGWAMVADSSAQLNALGYELAASPHDADQALARVVSWEAGLDFCALFVQARGALHLCCTACTACSKAAPKLTSRWPSSLPQILDDLVLLYEERREREERYQRAQVCAVFTGGGGVQRCVWEAGHWAASTCTVLSHTT